MGWEIPRTGSGKSLKSADFGSSQLRILHKYAKKIKKEYSTQTPTNLISFGINPILKVLTSLNFQAQA